MSVNLTKNKSFSPFGTLVFYTAIKIQLFSHIFGTNLPAALSHCSRLYEITREIMLNLPLLCLNV